MPTDTIRRYFVAAIFSVFIGSQLVAPTSQARESKRPNILFIFADDQSFETIHAHGLDEIDTPALDSLAQSGISFTHAYNMGAWNGAVCVASRAMLNTGRFLWHANANVQHVDKDVAAGRYWSQYMGEAGYETYFSGKWHVKAKTEEIFDHVVHERPGMPNQTEEGYDRPQDENDSRWKPWDKKFNGFWKDGKHWSEVLGDDALSFLERAQNRDNPFFMYLAFNAPHDPRQSPKEFVDRYPLDKIAVPDNFIPEYPYREEMSAGKNLRDEKLAPFPRTEYSVKVHRQEYYAIITHMDEQIGRILEALKKSGKADNTYIFFTADHGLAVGHHGLIGKQNMYDHSVRVPFIVVGPNIKADAKIGAPIYLQDIMPTTLELAGVKKPNQVQFNSLLPLIEGKTTESSYDAIYGAYLEDSQRMVTCDGYKLILYPKIAKVRLYHVAIDPFEMHDLAGDKAHAGTIKKLFAKLESLQEATGDQLDLSEPFGSHDHNWRQ